MRERCLSVLDYRQNFHLIVIAMHHHALKVLSFLPTPLPLPPLVAPLSLLAASRDGGSFCKSPFRFQCVPPFLDRFLVVMPANRIMPNFYAGAASGFLSRKPAAFCVNGLLF